MASQFEYDMHFDYISFYNQNATRVAEQYESVAFETVHRDLLEFLPSPPASALDIGAGSGRDANWLSKSGFNVVAVEPSENLRTIAARLYLSQRIVWLDDRLPGLHKLTNFRAFDLILCSAVWMHLSRHEQILSMRRLSTLSAGHGRVCITFRSIAHEEIPLNEIVPEEVIEDARLVGFKMLNQGTSSDYRNREGIIWHSIVFQNTGDNE